MEIPAVWIFFGEYIHQDFLLDYPDFLSGIKFILHDMTTNQRLELLQFLSHINGNEYQKDELIKIWNSSTAQLVFTIDDISRLFSELFKIVNISIDNKGHLLE